MELTQTTLQMLNGSFAVAETKKKNGIIVPIEAIDGLEEVWSKFSKENDAPILLYRASELLKHDEPWIFCDQELPDYNEDVFIVVAKLDHGEDPTDTKAHWCIDYDVACRNVEGNWVTWNDWNGGQPFAIVAWKHINVRTLPSKDVIKEHKNIWLNVKEK
jgi:hypothetical protein